MSASVIGGASLCLSLLSGSTFSSFAKLLTTSFSPLSLLFVSELLTAFFVLFSFGFVPVIRELMALKKKDMRWLLLMGFLSGICGPLLWFTALSHTTAVNAGFFGKSEIAFMLIFAHIVLREKVTRAHYAAVSCIAMGIAVISFEGFTQGLSLNSGDLIIVCAALCYTMSNIVYRKKASTIEPHVALFFRSSTAITMFFLVSPFIQHPFIEEIMEFPPALIPVLIGFGFISRFFNSVMYYQAIELLPITTVSLVGSLDVIVSTAFAFFFLGEPVFWFQFLGGAFIIGGTILLEIMGSHSTKKHLERHLKQRV